MYQNKIVSYLFYLTFRGYILLKLFKQKYKVGKMCGVHLHGLKNFQMNIQNILKGDAYEVGVCGQEQDKNFALHTILDAWNYFLSIFLKYFACNILIKRKGIREFEQILSILPNFKSRVIGWYRRAILEDRGVNVLGGSVSYLLTTILHSSLVIQTSFPAGRIAIQVKYCIFQPLFK